MSASDWRFNIGIVLAAALTIFAGVSWGFWPCVFCAVLAVMYAWNGTRRLPRINGERE